MTDSYSVIITTAGGVVTFSCVKDCYCNHGALCIKDRDGNLHCYPMHYVRKWSRISVDSNEISWDGEYLPYHRDGVTYMRPYIEGEVVDGLVSISEADRIKGSPKRGDMIARNPYDLDDMWLVEAEYFAQQYKLS